MSADPTVTIANEPQPLAKKKKPKVGKKHIKWIILGAVVLIIALLIIIPSLARSSASNVVALSDTAVLQKTDIKNSINATGIVESSDSFFVYSDLNYAIKEVSVEVGDTVSAGDILCQLDSETLSEQVRERELSLNNSKNAGNQSVKTAEDNYQSFKNSIENNTNSSLLAAQSGIQSSYDAWVKATKAYDDYSAALDAGHNTTLLAQKNALDAADTALDNAEDENRRARNDLNAAEQALAAYDLQLPTDAEINAAKDAVTLAQTAVATAQGKYDTAYSNYQTALNAWNLDPTNATKQSAYNAAEAVFRSAEIDLTAAQNNLTARQQLLTNLETLAKNRADAQYAALQADYETKKSLAEAKKMALESAESNYDNAEESYDAAQRSVDNALADYKKNVDTAYDSYQNALASSRATEVSVQNQLDSYRSSVDSAKISANTDVAQYQLNQLRQDLGDTTVTTPVSGTVTAVYAEEGASGAGLLFVIENTQGLKVLTTVKGYDINTVQVGMPVTIKSDATGSTEYTGVISKIAPTSTKNGQGLTDTTVDVVFATEVAVTSQDTDLRIGLDVRLNYIVAEEKSVLAVPFSAVYQNANGQDCIMVAEEQRNGKTILRELAITTGVENDLDIAISGESVKEGLTVILEPNNYTQLLDKEVVLKEVAASTPNMMMYY